MFSIGLVERRRCQVMSDPPPCVPTQPGARLPDDRRDGPGGSVGKKMPVTVTHDDLTDQTPGAMALSLRTCLEPRQTQVSDWRYGDTGLHPWAFGTARPSLHMCAPSTSLQLAANHEPYAKDTIVFHRFSSCDLSGVLGVFDVRLAGELGMPRRGLAAEVETCF